MMSHTPSRPLPTGSGLRSTLTFVRGLARQPSVVAAVIPSSEFLRQRLCRDEAFTDAKLVVELGPGTGGTTAALLEAIGDDARLLAIELVPEFARQLESIRDPRLRVHQGDAANLSTILDQHTLTRPDVIVSGIPFSTIDATTARKIVVAIHAALPAGGTFLAYQVRDRISDYVGDLFGKPHVSLVLFNMPPLHLYRWQKPWPEGAGRDLT